MKESDLRDGERIICVVRHHGLFLFLPILLSLVVIGIPWLIYRLMVMKTDIWVITDRRLVDQTGIVSRTVKESPFEKINDASYTQGILGRIFDYGDLRVQTASTEGLLEIKMVKSPAQMKRALMEAVDVDLEDKPAPTA
jgi:uncharacterized membrane protein YdbT with pleckstrin-like domain